MEFENAKESKIGVGGCGVAHHQRGNNRSACFYAEEDYRRYLDTLKEQAEKYGCAIHAYVLMTTRAFAGHARANR